MFQVPYAVIFRVTLSQVTATEAATVFEEFAKGGMYKINFLKAVAWPHRGCAISLATSRDSKMGVGGWGSHYRGCRFVPKKSFLETSKATDGTKPDLNIGFQGFALIQGQIDNPLIYNEKCKAPHEH